MPTSGRIGSFRILSYRSYPFMSRENFISEAWTILQCLGGGVPDSMGGTMQYGGKRHGSIRFCR